MSRLPAASLLTSSALGLRFAEFGGPSGIPILNAVPQPPAGLKRRAKIWDLGTPLHCSVIGTCLTTGELRALAEKFGPAHAKTSSDHEIHGMAVLAIGSHNLLAKQLQKALDRRHAATIRQFGKLSAADALSGAWGEAMRSGDIPGAYWAVLTHPDTSEELSRRVFGDVHMLSHLVGAANRADIRRLQALEGEKATLAEKLARQEVRLRESIASRDAQISELSGLLSTRIAEGGNAPAASAGPPEIAALESLVIQLRKELGSEARRRERAEARLKTLDEGRLTAERTMQRLTAEVAALRSEVDVVEAALAESLDRDAGSGEPLDLHGVRLLYVGGRPQAVARIRSLVETASGELLHHDGGIEERGDILAGLVSRADVALFPADCISHNAALSLKRLCRQAGKPFIALRSSGIASALRALRAARIGDGSQLPA